MRLIGCQASVAAVLRVIAGKQHAIGTGRGFEAIVAVGLLRMKIKDEQQTGAFKTDQFVIGMLI